jgi:hypothetical protein
MYFCGRVKQSKKWLTTKTLSTLLLDTDLLSNRRLRNSYFSVTLKNTHQLYFFRKKVQLHFSVRKVQLVAVALFFKLRLHFSE